MIMYSKKTAQESGLPYRIRDDRDRPDGMLGCLAGHLRLVSSGDGPTASEALRMNEPERLTPSGAEIVEALTEFYEAIKQGPEALAKRFPARTVEWDLEPRRCEQTRTRPISRQPHQSEGTTPGLPGTD